MNQPHSLLPVAFVNTIYAVTLCTMLHVVFGFGQQIVFGWTGESRPQEPPTWVGAAIISARSSWPAIALATIAGLLGRPFDSGLLWPVIVACILSSLNPWAGLLVGGVIAINSADGSDLRS